MKEGGHVDTWLKSAAPGHCPCGKALPVGRTKLCGDSACLKKYGRLMTKDRRPPSYLREVTAHGPVKDNPRRVCMQLACGHAVETHRSTAQPVGNRARCLTCAAEAESTPPSG